MLLAKQHISGVAVVYPEKRKRKENEPPKPPNPDRPQGSLYSQQKRKISDAVEYMRRYALYKPRIFVATTPGFLELSKEQTFISKLTNNMRTNYSMKDYVWVRELTGNGFPHYHFVADIPEFDVVRLSITWSKYFGSTAKNSIRLGTKPNPKTGRRKYWIDSPKMSRYLGKYIGKGISNAEVGKRVRRFNVSSELAKLSEPAFYYTTMRESVTGKLYPDFEPSEGLPDWLEGEGYLQKEHYRWKKVSDHSIYFGSRK